MGRTAKYSLSFKLKAVKLVVEDLQSANYVSKQIGVERSLLRKWVAFYNAYGIKGISTTKENNKYSLQFKLRVVRSIEEKGLSLLEACIKYNVPSLTTVYKWHLLYLSKGIEGLSKQTRGRPKSMKKPIKNSSKKLTREEELLLENESLRAENALLKKLHALAQAKKKKQ